MKNIFLFIFSICFASISAQNQNVGIDTENPSRKLDVNGNLRVTTTNTVTNSASYDRIVTVNNTTGDVDYINIHSVPQTNTNNVEVRRSIYNAAVPDNTKECSCGDITFRINNSNTAEFKFNSATMFVTNSNATSINIGYGIKRWVDNTYNFVNRNVIFTNANFSTYQTLDTTLFSSASGSVRIYTIVPPKQNSLYRITLTRVSNTSTLFTYSLICEKFYVQSI